MVRPLLKVAFLNMPSDLADDPSPDWLDTAARSDTAAAYHEVLIDRVPRDDAVAAELYNAAIELVPAGIY